MAKDFVVETSARHVHVCQETLEKLFGKGYELTVKKDLSQPGQFACNERVTVVGSKKELANVSILGPCRKQTRLKSLLQMPALSELMRLSESQEIQQVQALASLLVLPVRLSLRKALSQQRDISI